MATRIVLTVLAPKRSMDVSGYSHMLNKLLYDEAASQRKLFNDATSTFTKKTKPNIEISKVKKSGFDRYVNTGTLRFSRANGIFSITNFGNDRWIISGPGKKAMRFLPEYSPSTSASRPFKPGKWQKTGDEYWVTRAVHQRVEPRRFDLAIVRRRKGYFVRTAKGRMNKQAKRHWV